MGCLKLTFASHPPSRWRRRRRGSSIYRLLTFSALFAPFFSPFLFLLAVFLASLWRILWWRRLRSFGLPLPLTVLRTGIVGPVSVAVIVGVRLVFVS